jgi:GNAT superfamily N-acetyltransferase
MEIEKLENIFQTGEKIYLSGYDQYIQTKIKVKTFDSEDPIYPEKLYKLKISIIDCKDNSKYIAYLDLSLDWIMDSKSPRFLDLFCSRDELLLCPLIYVYISTLFVERDYRGLGYGTLLLEHLEECLISSAKKFKANTLYIGVTDVSKLSGTSNSIYRKMDYEYKSESSKTSMKKVLEFENGEQMFLWPVSMKEMKKLKLSKAKM